MLVHKLIGAFFLILFAVSQAVASGRIEVKEKVTLKGPEITLGEVAEIYDLQPELSAELKQIRLGRAPLPGQTRNIRSSYLKIFLNRYDDVGFILDCPDQIEITTACQPLEVDALIEAGYYALLEGLGLEDRSQQGSGFQTKVEVTKRPKEMILPEGEVEFEIGSLPSFGTKTTRLSVPVKIMVDGEEYRRIQVEFKVKRFQSVVVAAGHLDRHHLLTDKDLKIESKEVGFSSRKTFYQIPRELIGYRTRRSIEEGTPLTDSMIEIPPLIHQGDIVTLEARWEGIIVSALGQARGDGRAGERIAVLNCDSKKVVEGIVRPDGVIVVGRPSP